MGCIPKERVEQEHRDTGVELAEVGTAASAVAAGSPKAAAQRSSSAASRDELLSEPYTDRFERSELGPDWRATSSAWHIEGGRLCAARAHNHPVWLARRIPTNARIEFDALSHSADGDIKAELWGDGVSAAVRTTYDDATGYLVIFGGWRNQFHVLTRLDEHGKDRIQLPIDPNATELRRAPVVTSRSYHFTVERFDGHTVRWLVNGQEMAVLKDDVPLSGPGHDHFGFNDWEAAVCFDNLTLTPI